jgi:TPR repeat protein
MRVIWLLAVALLAVGSAGLALGDGALRKQLSTPEQQLELAYQYLQAGQDQSALALFTKLANTGNPLAEYWLAHMMELGIGAKDPAKAVELYKRAAARGNVAAQARIGEIDLDGDIAPPDFGAARRYLKEAALQGNARAAMLLGRMHRLGLGAQSDPTESFAWFEVAALEGNALAQHERTFLLAMLDPEQQEAATARSREIMSAIENRTALPEKGKPSGTTAPASSKGSAAT